MTDTDSRSGFRAAWLVEEINKYPATMTDVIFNEVTNKKFYRYFLQEMTKRGMLNDPEII